MEAGVFAVMLYEESLSENTEVIVKHESGAEPSELSVSPSARVNRKSSISKHTEGTEDTNKRDITAPNKEPHTPTNTFPEL